MARDVATEKACIECLQVKPAAEFYRAPRMASGLRSRCKVCDRGQTKRWYSENADRALRLHLERHYGITIEEYDRLFEEQGGRCAICKEPPIRRRAGQGYTDRLCVDHDHDTGVVRGLLCLACNKAIGHFRDDPELMRIAIAYLEGGQ